MATIMFDTEAARYPDGLAVDPAASDRSSVWSGPPLRTALRRLYGTARRGDGPDTAAAAAALEVSRRTVQRWVHQSLLDPTWPATPLARIRGPLLRNVLTSLYGRAQRGDGPDTAAAAAALEVSRRTVQRWVHQSLLDPTWPATPPVPLRPPLYVLADEAAKARYARRALEDIQLPRGRGIKPAWRKQRWLDEHIVSVVSLPSLSLRRITAVRADATPPIRVGAIRPLARLHQRGEVVDYAVVNNRFAATVVKAAVLEHVDPWRVQAPIGRGGTEAWLEEAPMPDLAALAVQLGAR